MNKFADWLNEYLRTHKDGWTQTRVATEAGISTGSMSMVMSGQQQVTFEFCSKVARALNLPPTYVFRKAGLLSPPNETPTFRELMAIVGELPIEEQREILEYALYRRSRLEHREDRNPAGQPAAATS